MRQRIDITDMEVRTKIRAKYLRALENEEWDLLPGPTYVRSFLRTYADALDLDGRALVEEYKLRHDPLETGELHPIRRPTAREQKRRRNAAAGGGRGGGIPPFAIVLAVLVAVFVALSIIGSSGGGDNNKSDITTTPTQTTAKKKPSSKKKPPPKPTTVRVQIVPTAPISVCLVDARDRVLIGNQILQPGQPSKIYKSKRFRVVLGNNALQLKVNGKTREVPASSGPIAYTITKNGRTDLPADRRPSCQ